MPSIFDNFSGNYNNWSQKLLYNRDAHICTVHELAKINITVLMDMKKKSRNGFCTKTIILNGKVINTRNYKLLAETDFFSCTEISFYGGIFYLIKKKLTKMGTFFSFSQHKSANYSRNSTKKIKF